MFRGLYVLQKAIWFIRKDNLGSSNTMIYFHKTWKKEQLVQDTPPLTTAIWFECLQFYGNGCHKNLSALFYNNLAITSPYWCPPSSPLLSPVSSEIWQGRARDTNIGDSRFNSHTETAKSSGCRGHRWWRCKLHSTSSNEQGSHHKHLSV